MINNSVPTKFRGRANGIAMGLSSLLKTIGPSAGALLFAWSINDVDNSGFQALQRMRKEYDMEIISKSSRFRTMQLKEGRFHSIVIFPFSWIVF